MARSTNAGRFLPLVALVAAGLAPCLYAWGPATHLAHLPRLLAADPAAEHRVDLPAAARACMEAQRDAFALGLAFPDIREAAKPDHPLWRTTHDYGFVFSLQARAATDRERAFALGSLAHLGQDTVSQLFYVPRKMCAGRIGVFEVAGVSQEDLIEGMVETYHGAFGELRDVLRHTDAALVGFYADAVAAYTGDPACGQLVRAAPERLHNAATAAAWTGRPAGLLGNGVLVPLTCSGSRLADPLFYLDAPDYLDVGNCVFADLARHGRASGWCRDWPIWSRKVQLFAGTQGSPLLKLRRCRNGALLYDAAFLSGGGTALKTCPPGSGQVSLLLEFSCTSDVRCRASAEVLFRGADGQTTSVARGVRELDMRLLDPGHRCRLEIPLTVPASPGTLYFTLDMASGLTAGPELSSLEPRCPSAQRHSWPPVLQVREP